MIERSFLWVDHIEDDIAEESEEVDDDMINERTMILNSLHELKTKLTEKREDVSSHSQSIDPQIFDQLTDSLVQFHLPFPLPPSPHLNTQFVCETASRLLFLSINWARSIPVFQTLPYSTKVSLLKRSWADLFILSLAQCKEQISLPAVLTAVASHLQASLGQDSLSLTSTKHLLSALTSIKNIVSRLDELMLEPEEFAYLRLVSVLVQGSIKYPSCTNP